MNILLIDNALPSSVFSGKTVRLKNIYGRLAKAWSIFYLRTAEPGARSESEELEIWARETFAHCLRLGPMPTDRLLSKFRNALRLRPWFDVLSKHPELVDQLKKRLHRIITEHDIDLVITLDLEVAFLGEVASSLTPDRGRPFSLPWIQDLGDSTKLQIKRRLSFAEGPREFLKLCWRYIRETKFEKAMIEKAAANLFVAEEDAVAHHQKNLKHEIRNPKQIRISKNIAIPNGVNISYFSRSVVKPVISKDPYVVFTGHMSFLPNQDAAIWFAHRMFPLIRKSIPNLKFKIVGADPSLEVMRLENYDIEVTGQVPDVRPYVTGALAFVCPMRMGSGIKNKVLEALAMEVPVITTPLGISGIANLNRATVYIASSAYEFVDHVESVLRDPLSARQKSKDGREFVEKHYSWEQSLESYRAIFEKTVQMSESK